MDKQEGNNMNRVNSRPKGAVGAYTNYSLSHAVPRAGFYSFGGYFLGLFAGLSGSAFAFGGLPLPGTLRIASKSSLVYKASLETGFISNSKMRCLVVLVDIPILSAISFTVKNSLPFISIFYCIGKYWEKYTQKVEILYSRLGKFNKKIKKICLEGIIYIDKYIHSRYIYT